MFIHHVSFDLQHFGLATSAPHSTSVGVLADKASVRNYTADDTHESLDKTPPLKRQYSGAVDADVASTGKHVQANMPFSFCFSWAKRASASKYELNETRRNKTRRNETKQDEVEQDKMRRNETEQDKTRQNKMEREEMK
jgi:hypothetical protein